MARPRHLLHESPTRPAGRHPLATHDAAGRPLVRLQTLGASTILVGGEPLTMASETLFSLLLRVACAPDLRVGRDELLMLLWPRQPDDRRRANLRQTLYKLRGMGVRLQLNGSVVELDPGHVVPTFSVARSSDTFERDVTLGQEPFGPFLPGLQVPWPEFQDWIDHERETVHAEIRSVLADQLRRRRERADWGGAAALARDLLQFDALNEEATLTLAESAALAGSKAEAIGILDRYLAELGPLAGDIRLPATLLRRRIADPPGRARVSFAPAERHFVGRDAELAELTLAIRRARWNDGTAMLVHGTAGIGKSRLTHEVEKVATIEGVRVLRAGCRETDGARVLATVLEILPDLLAQQGALGCAPESLAVLRQIATTDTTTAGDAAGVTRDPVSMAGIRRAVIDLVSAISEEKPRIWVVEDVHWVDDRTWELLCDLMDRISGMRMVLLLTSREPHARPVRPQRMPPALALRRLPPLTREQSALLSRAIGQDLSATITDEISDWLVRASEGIPLFLRSLVNHWIATGDAGGVPPTLHGVIDQRLSQLGSDALRVIQTGTLLGRWATVPRVVRVLELRANEMLQYIEQIESLGAFAADGGNLLAAHELVARAAHARLSRFALETLHRRAGEVLLAEAHEARTPELLLSALEHIAACGDMPWLARETMGVVTQLTELGVPERGLAALRRVDVAVLSPTDRSAMKHAIAKLLVRAGEYSRALDTHADGDTLPPVTEALTDAEADAGLSLADSLYRADREVDRARLVAFMVAVAECAHLARTTRLRAVDMGLIMIANECDAPLARRIFHAVRITDAEIHENDTCRRVAILYHAQFGDRARAIAIAKSLYARAKSEATSIDTYSDALRAGVALKLCGRGTGHLDALALALDISIRSNLDGLSVNAAWHLALSYLELDEPQLLRAGIEQVKRLYLRSGEPVSCNYVHGLLCREAIESGDADEAGRQLGIWRQHLPRYESIRSFAHSQSLAMAVNLMDPAFIPTVSAVEALLRNLSKLMPFGSCDFLVATSGDCIMRLGNRQDARTLVLDYIARHRREADKLGVHLQRTVNTLIEDPEELSYALREHARRTAAGATDFTGA